MAESIGVVGAGLMGAEIALAFALAGYQVLLNDSDRQALERGITRLGRLLDKELSAGRVNSEEAGRALAAIHPSPDLAAFGDVSFVTEAVFETPDVKSGVLAQLGRVCPPDCVITTNTSTIPISTLATMLPPERRGQFIGTHYFSPVSRMKLVEVIPGFETTPATLEAAKRLMTEISKVPVCIKDVTGFAVNRLLHAFMIEAVRLVEEGVASPADIDIACKLGLGHPIGPFALMDAVTSSLCVQAQEIMQEAYGERFRPRPLLKQRVRAGYGGGKGNPGWLTHGNGK